MIKKIEEILDLYVRPKLLEHYGNVTVEDFTDGIVKIKLTGQCSNCPSAKYTVEDIIETELKKHIPEVKEVCLEQTVSDDLLNFAKKILNHEDKK